MYVYSEHQSALQKSDFFNITTYCFEPRLVFMHTQKPKKLISNVR